MDNFDFKKYLAEGKLLKENVPDNITSVVDDMTITMGEDAFIAAIFKALSLEDAKRVLRVITNDNPIENALGPVTYDWLKENEPTVFDDESMDELFNIISKYVEDPDDAQAELDSFDQGGFDAMSDMVIANLDRDPEYKAWYNKLHSIKEDINYDEFDEKPEEIAQTIDPEDLTYPLEYAMAWEGFDDLDDITTIKQFNDLIKAMKKTREVPAKFFDLKEKEQMGIIRQAVMYI